MLYGLLSDCGTVERNDKDGETASCCPATNNAMWLDYVEKRGVRGLCRVGIWCVLRFVEAGVGSGQERYYISFSSLHLPRLHKIRQLLPI